MANTPVIRFIEQVRNWESLVAGAAVVEFSEPLVDEVLECIKVVFEVILIPDSY
jgi:hypothetical protein